MATWDDILSHYSFNSKTYSELTDPADLRKPFVDFVPDYSIPEFRPNSNRFHHHEYYNILSPILTSTNTLYDFPIRSCSRSLKYPDLYHFVWTTPSYKFWTRFLTLNSIYHILYPGSNHV